MELIYAPAFVRQFQKLADGLQEDVLEKIELFKNQKNHKALKVHKLKGRLKGRWSFSVNYGLRIVFLYTSKQEATLLGIGDHSVYDI